MAADQDLHGIKKFNEQQLMKHCILYKLMCPAHPISNENLVNPISLENDNVANRVLATCQKLCTDIQWLILFLLVDTGQLDHKVYPFFHVVLHRYLKWKALFLGFW